MQRRDCPVAIEVQVLSASEYKSSFFRDWSILYRWGKGNSFHSHWETIPKGDKTSPRNGSSTRCTEKFLEYLCTQRWILQCQSIHHQCGWSLFSTLYQNSIKTAIVKITSAVHGDAFNAICSLDADNRLNSMRDVAEKQGKTTTALTTYRQ